MRKITPSESVKHSGKKDFRARGNGWVFAALPKVIDDLPPTDKHREEYLSVDGKAWRYLTDTALQEDGLVGYMQPIGEKAIPGQVVDAKSIADFGTGAFMMAASEMARFLENKK